MDQKNILGKILKLIITKIKYLSFLMNTFFNSINKSSIQWIAIILICLITLLFVLPFDFILIKKISPYAIYWMYFCLFFGISCLMFNLTHLLYVSFSCCGIIALFLLTSFNSSIRFSNEESFNSVSIVFINPTLGNEDLTSNVFLFQQLNPDIICIEELTPDWVDFGLKNKTKYPYQTTLLRVDPLGKGIYSKLPFIHVDTLNYQNKPILLCTIQNENKDSVCIGVCNTPPPLTLRDFQRLTIYLDSFAIYLQKRPKLQLIATNLNIVPWSSEFRRFKTNSNLFSSRRDNNEGINSSFFSIPNNEILFSNLVECTSFSVIQDSKNKTIGIFGKYQFKKSN